jgi:antitoxin HicB
MTTIPSFEQYTFDVAPLSDENGGGFLITWPDLPGCMSDGESIEEAIDNGRDAFQMWMETYIEQCRELPKPGSVGSSGKFVQRVPKSLHSRLAAFAKSEGVSMNTLVATMLAESLGKREAHFWK